MSALRFLSQGIVDTFRLHIQLLVIKKVILRRNHVRRQMV